MFGMNGTMTGGFILLAIGLVILLFQFVQNLRTGGIRPADDADTIQKIIELIKKHGLGLVLVSAGIVVILIGAAQGNGAKDNNESGTPAAMRATVPRQPLFRS
jgi:alcohol dehydrogenase YqhD (iron-dependent ADH family)